MCAVLNASDGNQQLIVVQRECSHDCSGALGQERGHSVYPAAPKEKKRAGFPNLVALNGIKVDGSSWGSDTKLTISVVCSGVEVMRGCHGRGELEY